MLVVDAVLVAVKLLVTDVAPDPLVLIDEDKDDEPLEIAFVDVEGAEVLAVILCDVVEREVLVLVLLDDVVNPLIGPEVTVVDEDCELPVLLPLDDDVDDPPIGPEVTADVDVVTWMAELVEETTIEVDIQSSQTLSPV